MTREDPGPPGSEGRLPNNWRAAFPGVGLTDLPPAWTWDASTGQWYLHLFLPQQPDLNWMTPDVRVAMTDVLRFWLARGVDGFRIDVVHGLGKDPALPDLPPELARIPVSGMNDQPETHPILAALRRALDGWPDPPARLMVGEVFLPEPSQVITYYGTAEEPELHLAFNFKPLFTGGTRRLGSGALTRWRPCSNPGTPGPPGCCRITTGPVTGPATAPRPGREPRPCCC